MDKNKTSFTANVKEGLRKTIVRLKRRPHNIALFFMIVSFVVYSFNLTKISNTTALVGGANMGLCSFVTMLFSVLSVVSFLNAFPKRKKAVVIMVIILFVMIALVIFADVYYYMRIDDALTRADNKLVPNDKQSFVYTAQDMLIAHVILEAFSALQIVLIPVYGKLFKRINTSKKIEDNGELETVELSE